MPSTFRVPNTNFYRAPQHGDDLEAFGRWAADEIAVAIENEGPETVAAVFLEPVQNAGGCFPPPPGYFQRVREICDQYDVLLVSDEVICAFGRLGHMFAAERYGYQPDMITFAKGVTSGYSPLGGMMATDRLMEPFLHGTNTFVHGYTFGGHPVSTAVALANLDMFENEGINKHVRANEGAFRSTLEKLNDLPIVGDVRGDGYFYGIELVKDKATKETFDDAEAEKLLRGFLSKALFDAGLYCRADDRGDPVVQFAPPLICEQEHFDEIEQLLRAVLTRRGPCCSKPPSVNARAGSRPLGRFRPAGRQVVRLGVEAEAQPVQRPQPQVAPALARVGAGQRPPGELDRRRSATARAGTAAAARAPSAAGSARCPRPPAGRASPRRRTGTRRRRAR